MESRQGVRRGDRLWQLSFGSGFKCNSATWTALRDCNEQVPLRQAIFLAACVLHACFPGRRIRV